MEFNIAHIVGAALAGGCATPLVQFAIDKWKGNGSRLQKIHQRITDHEEKDDERFQYFDQQSTERHFEVLKKLGEVSEGVAFIKGKMEKS